VQVAEAAVFTQTQARRVQVVQAAAVMLGKHSQVMVLRLLQILVLAAVGQPTTILMMLYLVATAAQALLCFVT
jgi:hypothetical protein